jgi:LmbE family N-acetylglucosaminyl deacetylase
LVISAHPDDETLGCGGTLLKHRDAGDEVFWIIVTKANEPQWSGEMIEKKKGEIKAVSEAYGFADYVVLGYPAAQLDSVPKQDLIQSTADAVSKIQPETVYVVHGGDVHSDHSAVFNSTMSALKPAYMSRMNVRRILCQETLSSTEAAPPNINPTFVPTVFSDITPFLDRKLEIMDLYATEAQADPMPRGPSAIRSLARYRGATIGVEYAEAFMLMRELV